MKKRIVRKLFFISMLLFIWHCSYGQAQKLNWFAAQFSTNISSNDSLNVVHADSIGLVLSVSYTDLDSVDQLILIVEDAAGQLLFNNIYTIVTQSGTKGYYNSDDQFIYIGQPAWFKKVISNNLRVQMKYIKMKLKFIGGTYSTPLTYEIN